ncbi:MAG: DNA internalization-related competence protein ComEC/Rec2 [Bacillota bacterium]|nr:DNA internalization-related competence protein ComEC/Rec2 [Bacillota bacterium]
MRLLLLSLFLLGILFSEIFSTKTVLYFALIILISVFIYLISKKRGKNAVYIILSVFFFIAGLFPVYIFSSNFDVIQNNFSENSLFYGRVSELPANNGDETKIRLRLYEIKNSKLSQKTNKSIYVYLPSSKAKKIEIGNILMISGEISYPEPKMNFGDFDYSKYYRSCNILGFCSNPNSVKIYDGGFSVSDIFPLVRKYVATQTDRYISGMNGEFVKGVLLGDTSGFSDILTQNIRKIGISHVTAVSGMHIALFMMFFLSFSNIFTKSRRKKAVIIIFSLFFCTAATGFSPSVLRAFVMSTCVLIGVIVGRRASSVFLLVLSACIMLSLNPYLFYNPSFILSFLSTAGLILYMPSFLRNSDKSSMFKETLLMTVISNIVTLPYVIWNFGSYSWIGILSNIVIVPFIEFIFIGSLLTVILGAIPALGVICGFFTKGFSALVLAITNAIASLPFGQFSDKIHNVFYVLAYVILLVLIYFHITNKKSKIFGDKLPIICYTLVVVFFCGGYLLNIAELRTFNITYVYVGEGDCAAIHLPYGNNILIDTGDVLGDKSKSLTYLENSGIKKLDSIMISHSDKDHCGALETILSSVPTDTLYLTSYSEKSGDASHLIKIAKKYGTSVKYINAGNRLTIGNAVFSFVYPYNGMKCLSSNDSSMVVNLSFRGHSFLFTGDISQEGEKTLERAGALKHCDVLKVAHHGSATSTSENFVTAVSPKYAVISSGRNNIYSHPADIIPRRLAEGGAHTYITANVGAVRFTVSRCGDLYIKSVR